MSKAVRNRQNNTMEIAGEALIYAADCIEKIDENDPMGPRYTWRRGFNAADSHNMDSPATGDDFDEAEDIYSEVLADVTVEGGMSGTEAAEAIRSRGENLLNVA